MLPSRTSRGCTTGLSTGNCARFYVHHTHVIHILVLHMAVFDIHVYRFAVVPLNGIARRAKGYVVTHILMDDCIAHHVSICHGFTSTGHLSRFCLTRQRPAFTMPVSLWHDIRLKPRLE